MTDGYFRGYHAIQEVVCYMEPLADWMAKYKPENRELTLKGPDYDLIKRWPKASSVFNIRVDADGSIRWRGFTLKRDKKASRYKQAEATA